MVRSGLTISNQDRLRRYNEERRQEERNDVVQQAELYGYLAEENKLDAQATSLARLAKNVFKKSFDIPKAIEPAIIKEITKTKLTLLDAIKQGKLDELVKSIIAIPENQLNARQKIIQKDLGNKEFKQSINDAIAEDVAAGKSSEEIMSTIAELLGGTEGKADVEGLIGEAQEGGVGEVKPPAEEGEDEGDNKVVDFTIQQKEGTKNEPIDYSELISKISKLPLENKQQNLIKLIDDSGLNLEKTGTAALNYNKLEAVFKTAMSKYNLVKNVPENKMKDIREKRKTYKKFIL